MAKFISRQKFRRKFYAASRTGTRSYGEPNTKSARKGTDGCNLQRIGIKRNYLFLSLCHKLGFGEASCLAIAKQRGWAVLTDDRAARKVAKAMTVTVSGRLGVLKLAVEQGLLPLDEGNNFLQQMIRGRYRSPIHDLSEIIELP